MTDLEESLIAAGAVVVVGVFLYNKWQEYKTKRSVERAFSSTHDDVLMQAPPAAGGRHEPSFGDGEMHAEHVPLDERLDARVAFAVEQDVTQADVGAAGAANAADADAAPGNVPPAKAADLPIDDMIDLVIPLVLATRVRGDKIIRAVQTVSHAGNKPVHFVGLREDEVWENIAHESFYVALHAGVQLANRSGSLNELEYSELVNRLRQVGEEFDAEPDLPDMKDVMKSARALLQVVSQFDAQLSVNIQSKGAPWAIGTLLAALGRQGFDVRSDGKLAMPDGDGGVLFSLSTNVTLAEDTTSRLTLLLDVPCVAPQRDGYSAMISFARVLANRLDGAVVDDTNQPLPEVTLNEIAGQVQAFCREMETLGIPAGSPRALRLFS